MPVRSASNPHDGVVDLLGDDGIARRVAVAHADPQQVAVATTLLRYSPSLSSDGPEEQIIRTGSSLFLETVTEERIESAVRNAEHLEVLRSINIDSAIVAPVSAGGAVHGALTLCTTISHRRFDEDDRALAEQLARRSAVAIQNARPYRHAQAAKARYRGLFTGTKAGPESHLRAVPARRERRELCRERHRPGGRQVDRRAPRRDHRGQEQ
jgi:GAF domain-containing protein